VETEILYKNVFTSESQRDEPECAAASFLSNEELNKQLTAVGSATKGSRMQREGRLNQIMFGSKIEPKLSSPTTTPVPGRKFEGMHTMIEPEEVPILALRWTRWRFCTLFRRTLVRCHFVLSCFNWNPSCSQKSRVLFFAADATLVMILCMVFVSSFGEGIRTPEKRSIDDLFTDGPLSVVHIVLSLVVWPVVSTFTTFLITRHAIRAPVYDVTNHDQRLQDWKQAEALSSHISGVVAALCVIFTVVLGAFLIPQTHCNVAFKMWVIAFTAVNVWQCIHAFGVTVLLKRAASTNSFDALLTVFPQLYCMHHVLEGGASPSQLHHYWTVYYEQEKRMQQAE